jgi:AcrR family transcriptional regulator
MTPLEAGSRSIPEAQLRRPPARPRGEATVERLLVAADELLSRGGAQALGTKQVAHAAGVSVGTVYNWFPDKESIAEALALRYWHELYDLLVGVAEAVEAGGVEDPIGEAIDAIAAGFRARPGFLALWFGGLRTERLRDATRPGRVGIGESVQRILAVAYPGSAAPELETVARMRVLIGDGIVREAFRIDRAGDDLILAEGRTALRAYAEQRLWLPAT